MKRIALMLAATIFMFSTVPAFSEMTKTQKDECLLASKNCATQVDDIQKRVRKLNKEIKKGTKVYSADELNKLQLKLKETQDMLDTLEKGGN